MMKGQGQHLETVVYMQVSRVSRIILLTPGDKKLVAKKSSEKACLSKISGLNQPELNIWAVTEN